MTNLSLTYFALTDRLKQRGLFHIEPGLSRVQTVLNLLGNPQDSIPAVHVAGTNGKGSVCAAIESGLRAAGYRVGLYTSPHLVDVRERIQIDRELISEKDFVLWSVEVLAAERQARTRLTYFEFLTVLAFLYFARTKVDIGVIEVGLGGQWDATNSLKRPLVSVITEIGIDHTQWLGKTRDQIAVQKAGIVKKRTEVVSGVTGSAARVIAKVCRSQQAALFQKDIDFSVEGLGDDGSSTTQRIRYSESDHFWLKARFALMGKHQVANAAVAIATLRRLVAQGWPISPNTIAKGLARVQWAGRFQWLRQPGHAAVLLDGAHNPQAIDKLLETLLAHTPAKGSIDFVFSAYRDKDIAAMAKGIAKVARRVYLAALPGPRSTPIEELRAAFASHPSVVMAQSVRHALSLAQKNATLRDVIVATGSLTLIGDLLSHDFRTLSSRN